MTNRLHSRTRWPERPAERIVLADNDLDFLEALVKCEIEWNDSMDRIYNTAVATRRLAVQKLYDRENFRRKEPKQ